MSRIDLDFTAPGSHPGPFSWLLLALGLLAAAAMALAWQSADVAASAAQALLAASAPAVKPTKTVRHLDPAAEMRQSEEAAARRALALSWNRLLTTLQETQAEDVVFLLLDADGRRGDFQITADARSYTAMLDYFRTLQAEPAFRAVILTRHELQEIDGVQGVNFSLRGEWTHP